MSNDIRAALAQPEGEGPSAADLLPVNPPNIPTTMAMQYRSAWREGVEDGWNEARAALARWGRPTPPAPEAVSERLPGEGDCDAEGRCWLFSKVESEWRLLNAANPGVPHLKYCFSHWLPAHAIPHPQVGEVQS